MIAVIGNNMPGISKEIDSSSIEIKIMRSNRKSVVGDVLPDGKIEVRAPLAMTTEEIRKWLDRFEPKFMPIIRQCREMNAYISRHPFGYGGEVLFMGNWIPIKEAVDDNGGYTARYSGGAVVMRPGFSEDKMRDYIMDLFYGLAVAVFEKKLHRYSDLMDVEYKSWTIGYARKKHASCSSNGKITLSWLVIMMGEPVIDYIIVHELAHLKRMNHSKAFHDEVSAILPDLKERRAAYREYCHMLYCGGWI